MKNNLGIFYAYWQKDWMTDFAECARRAAELGFDEIQYELDSVLTAGGGQQEELKETIDELDLEISFSMGLPAEYDISSADSKVRRKGINYLQNSIRKAAEFDCQLIGGLLYGGWGEGLVPGLSDKSDFLQRSIDSMKRVMETAEVCEVNCAVEVVNRFEQFMLNTSAEAVEYVERIDSPRLGIHLDTFHMNIEEHSFADAVETAGDKLFHFHVGENNRRPPGEGEIIPWQEVFDALKGIDYQGSIVMEPFVRDGGDIAQDIMIWRDGEDDELDLDERAERAREFLEDLLA
ncbi:sugar phosphate isomerase/epimerase family protein [Halarsenatibacter silvermanii]|uniref:D-tagatose 3-epimerase n=1 Tax=Halarsenatibacter silvermanii TaxID=321763 RepID=A0A1G9LYY4_9FIRM|nr:sugar phosphate isomerase/epimerase family protein [Halarsenatibacter silvermanii]SDL67123.1 D-tagatose 3-epimerase [Halarsenatibacter silvermanii]